MAEDCQCPGLTGLMTITSWEPGITAIIDGRPISLLIDTDTTFSALLEFWRLFQATLTLHPSPHKLQPINPSSPSLWSLFISIGALLPHASPNSLPLPTTLVKPIV
jgi:hypothetical protein